MAEPNVAREIQQAYDFVVRARSLQRRVGLVPTMGALHAGHLSLVRTALNECDDVVVTIFVNPTQFGPGEDLDRYPRSWEADLESLNELGVALVFAPAVPDMYPPGCTTCIQPPVVANSLEGEHRPGHFRGVATIVLKLFQILPADCAFFGEKDFQQCLVIRDMVRDLNIPISVRFCATVREVDGLAMSSRNRYLSTEQRARALGLVRSLDHAETLVSQGEADARTLEQAVRQMLHQYGVDSIDYVALCSDQTLEPLDVIERTGVLLIAAHVGTTRLIDNRRLMRAAAPMENA